MKKDVSIYFDLMNSLRTTQEVADFLCEIDTFMLEKKLDLISTDSAEKIRQVFAKNKLNINDKDTVATFFTNLKELLKKLKVIKLIVAFCPNYKMIENIHNFIKESLGAGYILDIEILDEVLGGAIIIYNGRYFDFSLKKTIEQAFTNKSAEILKFIN